MRPIFRPIFQILSILLSAALQLLHNFGSQIPFWGEAVFIFGAKLGLKCTKYVRFCILFRPMGEARAPPLATLLVVLVDSQAAIKSLIKCTVTSITVFNCIRNLNQLGKQKPRQYCLDSWSCRST